MFAMGKCDKCGKEVSFKVEDISKKKFNGRVLCYPGCQKEEAGQKSEIQHPKEVAQIMGVSTETKIQRQAMAKVAAILVASANRKEKTKISVLELVKTTQEIADILLKYVNK